MKNSIIVAVLTFIIGIGLLTFAGRINAHPTAMLPACCFYTIVNGHRQYICVPPWIAWQHYGM